MTTNSKKHIAIIGMGRFGKTLYRLLSGSFHVVVWDANPAIRRGLRLGRGDGVAKTLWDALQCSVIFYAVPIRNFEAVLRSHKKHLRPDQLLVDTLSVKTHPARVIQKVLGTKGPRALLTHPLFGPDSSRDGFKALPIVLDRFTSTAAEYGFWKRFFRAKGLWAIELSPEEHDRIAANSQGLTHVVGRMLEAYGFAPTLIDTLGAKKLHEVEDQVVHDTRDLFADLQQFNPYTKRMRKRLGAAYATVSKPLLPKRANPDTLTIGIQGGEGSFNEQAVREYLRKKRISNYALKYLFTSGRVLSQLHDGRVDLGFFAMHNAAGGTVRESMLALSRHSCAIKAEFPTIISHHLMKRKDNPLSRPRVIMAHDQVFAQCKKALARRYQGAKLVTGKGDLMDTALAARALSEGKLPKSTFILGPKSLSKLFGLTVVASDLQDLEENYTTFLLVGRP